MLLAALQFIVGMGLIWYGSYKIDAYDDDHGIRPGARADGYGTNVSWVWPYSFLCQIGFIGALCAPVTWIIAAEAL